MNKGTQRLAENWTHSSNNAWLFPLCAASSKISYKTRFFFMQTNYFSQRRSHEPPTLTAYHFSPLPYVIKTKFPEAVWTPRFYRDTKKKTSASGAGVAAIFQSTHPRESVGNWKPPLYFSRPQISTELCLKTSSFRSNTCHFPNNAIR